MAEDWVRSVTVAKLSLLAAFDQCESRLAHPWPISPTTGKSYYTNNKLTVV